MSFGYVDILNRRCSEAVLQWYSRALFEDPQSFKTSVVTATYAGCARRVGHDPVRLDPAEQAELTASGLVAPVGWPLMDVARAALILHAARVLEPDGLIDLLDDLFYRGDSPERQALLRTLPMLPNAERALPLAIEACRTNVESVFAAIAFDNAYPAEHFPDRGFNQLVLKALFMDANVDRIVDLAKRTTPELGRMVEDYADERRAAGRPVPAGVPRVLEHLSR